MQAEEEGEREREELARDWKILFGMNTESVGDRASGKAATGTWEVWEGVRQWSANDNSSLKSHDPRSQALFKAKSTSSNTSSTMGNQDRNK